MFTNVCVLLKYGIRTDLLIKKNYISIDDRILEYDIDQVIFEGTSPFQKIQIVHSKSLGNMLVLDELQSKFIYKNLLQ